MPTRFLLSLVFMLLWLMLFSCCDFDLIEQTENNQPNTPAYPHPADDEDSVSIRTFLSWGHSGPVQNPMTYDIYLGSSTNPPLIRRGHTTKFFFPETLNGNSTYYWKIVATDQEGLTTEGPLWRFYTKADPDNNPPDVPSDPWPEHGATSFIPPVALSWTCGDQDGDALSYHLYWGETEGLINHRRKIDSPNYAITNLTPWCRYYWQVIAEDEHGAATEGPVWEFTVAPGSDNKPPYEPYSPFPADGENNVDPVSVTLSWTGGDPDSDEVTYELSWGDSEMMWNKEYFLGSVTQYAISNLLAGTQYYWQVIAEDEHHCRTEGPIWTFWTSNANPLWICTTGYYPETADLDAIVKDLFGPYYRVADWNDLVAYSANNSIVKWADEIDMRPGYPDGFLVTCGGNHYWAGTNRHYWIDRHDHQVPENWLVHATIYNHYIDLGSWYNMYLRILCIRTY